MKKCSGKAQDTISQETHSSTTPQMSPSLPLHLEYFQPSQIKLFQVHQWKGQARFRESEAKGY